MCIVGWLFMSSDVGGVCLTTPAQQTPQRQIFLHIHLLYILLKPELFPLHHG